MKGFIYSLLSILIFYSTFLYAAETNQLSHATIQQKNITGLWQTVDNFNRPRSIVEFYYDGREWRAKIVKVFNVKGKDNQICSHCKGELKNKPLIGLNIITGLKEKNGEWVGGTVLDVDSGKIYNVKISLSPDGKTMYFHVYFLGSLGISINWQRVK